MWWIEDRPRGSNSSRRQRLNTRNHSAYRSLRLSADQHAANLELIGVATDLDSLKSLEVKRLEADIRALERVIHEGRAERQRQDADLMRLRSECERWLNETQLLSAQLSAEVGRRTEITQQAQQMPLESQLQHDSRPEAA